MCECVTYGCIGKIQSDFLPQEEKRKPDLCFEALSAQTVGGVEMDACLETTERIISMLSF